MTLRALLVDYGNVVSDPQPAEAIAALAAAAGLDGPVFVQRYWEHRLAYDLGMPSRTYWSAVLQTDSIDDRLLAELVRLDMASWSRLNAGTLAVLTSAHEHGVSLSLLSNAPHELAAVIGASPELAIFDHLMFSAQLGMAKPDPAVYRVALDTLSERPADVLFVDDRPENVQAAIDTGLRGALFTSADALRSELSW